MLHAFLLACLSHPAVVKSAHEELDKIMGDEIPRLEHMSKLPYVYAVVKETLRWAPVTPLAFPHKSEVDDEYKGFKVLHILFSTILFSTAGYQIPAGTYIIVSSELTCGARKLLTESTAVNLEHAQRLC